MNHQFPVSLLRLPINIYPIHYVELVLIVLAVIYYKKLKRNKLTILLYLSIAALVIDLVVVNSFLIRFVRFPEIIKFLIIVLGIYLYASVKKLNLQLLLVIIAARLLREILLRDYSLHGKYNLFIQNFYYIISPFFFYLLFSIMLNLKGDIKKLYFFFAITSELFFLRDYFTHDDSTLRYLSIVTLHLQCVMLSCWVISKLVINEMSTTLVNNPFFWVCFGTIIVGIVTIVCDGLHPFLVANYIEVYKNRLLLEIEDLSELILDLSYMYAIILCRIHYSNNFSFFKPFQNKEPHH
jgi:hypothetical protein